MIRLGRVYRGLMVDVQATNTKLTRRKEEMLVYLTGRNRQEAQTAIAAADGDLKLAVLLLNGCEPGRARALLAKANGRLRTALALLAPPGR
jgi:N-acetylmuramic acid 6-phosphate etherase